MKTLLILTVAILFTACSGQMNPYDPSAPPQRSSSNELYHPLNEYNNAWVGQVSLDTGAHYDISAKIFQTSDDTTACKENGNLVNRAYIEMDISGYPRPLAGVGDLSHYQMQNDNPSGYRPIDEKEFVEFQISSRCIRPIKDVNQESGICRDQPSEIAQKYNDNFDHLVRQTGWNHPCGDVHTPVVVFYGERVSEQRIDGTVWVEHMQRKECDLKKGLEVVRQPYGEFTLSLISNEKLQKNLVSPSKIETNFFRFTTDRTKEGKETDDFGTFLIDLLN